jgi:hypothetical protein
LTLAEASLHLLVGLRGPAPVTAGMLIGGREVFTVRPVPVADWAAEGPAVAGTVTFGPFDVPVSFDGIRLYHGGEQLIDLPRLSTMSLDPGDVFEEQVFLDGSVA